MRINLQELPSRCPCTVGRGYQHACVFVCVCARKLAVNIIGYSLLIGFPRALFEMDLKSACRLCLFPVQMLYYILRASLFSLLPSRRKDVTKEVVLITGGGRGIGRNLAKEFAKQGARKVILWGRTEKCLKETAEEISLTGTECHYFLCDVANREEVYRQAKVVREKTTKAFLPRMLELQHGHVVCINSILSQSPIPGAIDYCTSKASSLAFMESLTLGLLDCPGVGCTTVLPFHTNTEMFQGMRVRFPQLFPPLRPEVVAQKTVDAVRADKAYLYLPWTMHALVFLKSFMPQVSLEEIYRFSGTYTCMNTFKGRT
ncbi:hypothetical protein FQN60_009679 [Etheostoma spectabile]|uniref:Ketoreductase domain-containing protein n=1 Tax=Etheostoma spectabile TaxID=54343 RepID=A0A5J5DJU7_9PERO|nr:hypothetical protein FQN60_009679 [Etheostoma spectabile]